MASNVQAVGNSGEQAQLLIEAGLGSQILTPKDPEYNARIESYWCNSAKLRPACIVRPRSATEVSQAVKALIGARQQFAVRGGGHNNWAGSNNIAGGVTSKVADHDFTSHVAFQPLSRVFVQQSEAMSGGGNVLGLEQNPGDALLVQADISVRTQQLAEWASPKLAALLQGIRDFAEAIDGGVLPWLYLNYAHPSQKVLESYGPENVQRTREAASRYDP
ncbi:hypothetical protein F4811DRAFT_574368 [Daldinia bambusicola]|nr:hypothetical protein F4811DRAFT_574368 [Daldinia bambusicola]